MAETETTSTTKEQRRLIEEQDAKFQQEVKLPLWEVVITGDEAVYVPRPNEKYFKQVTEEIEGKGPVTVWVPKEGKEVRLQARAIVHCHAASKEHAGMMALRANEDYHTIESVTELKE